MASSRHVSRPGRPVYGRPASRRQSSKPKLKLPRNAVKWGIILTIVLGMIAFISSVTTLKKVTIVGNHTLATDRLERLTATALSKQWFGKNTVLIDSTATARSIQSAEPGVRTIAVTKHLPSTLLVTVTERQPSLNWRSGGQLYLLDSDGTVLGISSGQYVKLAVVMDSANLPVKQGSRVVPRDFVTFATTIATQLPTAAKLQISQMTVQESTSELYVTTDKGLLLKFDTTRLAAGELSDLAKVLQQLQSLKKTPAQYIDLRVEHKAYYK